MLLFSRAEIRRDRIRQYLLPFRVRSRHDELVQLVCWCVPRVVSWLQLYLT